jgi:hypothetical protein
MFLVHEEIRAQGDASDKMRSPHIRGKERERELMHLVKRINTLLDQTYEAIQ